MYALCNLCMYAHTHFLRQYEHTTTSGVNMFMAKFVDMLCTYVLVSALHDSKEHIDQINS